MELVSNPKEFFASDTDVFEEVVSLVRKGFGRELDKQDIYDHVTFPESVYLLRREVENGNRKVSAMASYNKRVFSGIPSLIVEGIAVAPEMQGKGVFREMTNNAVNGEAVVCLRTQSPRMYRALEKYCSEVYPRQSETPEAIRAIRSDLARHLLCKIDDLGIVRGHYGGLFYGEEPVHRTVSDFFRGINLQLNNGDALLVVGVR